MFESVSCSKKHFKDLLEDKSYSQWNRLDDIALDMNPESAEFKHLLKQRGAE